MSPKSRHLISAGVLFSALAFTGASYAQSSGTTGSPGSGDHASGTQSTAPSANAPSGDASTSGGASSSMGGSSSAADTNTRTSPSTNTQSSSSDQGQAMSSSANRGGSASGDTSARAGGSTNTATPPASAASGTGTQDSQASWSDRPQAGASGTDRTRADAGSASSSQPHALRASKVIGAKVENPSGENLGDIKDMVVDLQNEQVRYVVLSHGGILGIGDKLFAYPMSMVRTKSGDDDKLVLDVDKEKLENAPGFGQKEWPDFSDREYTGRIDQYYGASTRSDGTTAGATIRASELIGKNFDDAQGKEAGEVEDLIVDASSGRIGYAIVDFDDDWNEQADGKLVAIPLSSFALRGDKHDELVIQSSPDRIDLSHAFAKSQWPDFNDPAWQRASTAPRSQTSEPPASQQTASASPRS